MDSNQELRNMAEARLSSLAMKEKKERSRKKDSSKEEFARIKTPGKAQLKKKARAKEDPAASKPPNSQSMKAAEAKEEPAPFAF